MKKTLSALLAASLCIGAFAGCGQQENEPVKTPETNVLAGDTGGLTLPLTNSNKEITWSVDSSVDDLNDKAVIKRLREVTGVNLKLEVFPLASAGEKIRVLAASKQLPDIVGQGLEPEFAEDLSVQGAFAPVQDYLDIVPNFKKIFVDTEENNWIFKSYAAPDGKLYGFYGFDWNRDVNHGMLYRKDIFDKHGIEMWNSPETFYEALKKLKELYPDSTPFAQKNLDQIFNRISTSWGIIAQNPYYDEANKEWKYSDTDPKYKEILDFVKKLYDEKLIDPEFLTATQAAWTSKMTQADKAFVTFDWIGRLEQFKQQTAETVPEYDLRFAPPIGPNQTYPAASQVCWARHVSSGSDVETCFKLLDFCLSPAGAELITMGIEGETYNLNENDDAVYVGFEDRIPQTTELEEKYGMFIQGMYLRFDRRSAHFQFSEREQEAQDYMNDGHSSPQDPILVFTTEEKELKNEKLMELQKAGLEFSAKYVLNGGGEKEWNEWLKQAEKLGSKEIEKIYNDAQKRYDAQ